MNIRGIKQELHEKFVTAAAVQVIGSGGISVSFRFSSGKVDHTFPVTSTVKVTMCSICQGCINFCILL